MLPHLQLHEYQHSIFDKNLQYVVGDMRCDEGRFHLPIGAGLGVGAIRTRAPAVPPMNASRHGSRKTNPYAWEMLALLWVTFFLHQAEWQIYNNLLPLILRGPAAGRRATGPGGFRVHGRLMACASWSAAMLATFLRANGS